MRLTNYIRDAFIDSVLADVPRGCDHEEAIRAIATEDVFSRLPKDVLKMWNDNGESRDFLIEHHDGYAGVRFCYPSTSAYSSGERPLSDEAKAKIDPLKAEMDAHETLLKGLRSKLKGAAYACTTVKQLRDLMPEFSDYLPEEDEPISKGLPVVANIVADFAKAGWPKTKGTA